MILSCCAWALAGPEPALLERLSRVGLGAVDIRPSMLRSPQALCRLDALGLRVCCVAAAHELPDGAALGAANPTAAAAAWGHVEAAVAHAAHLGAQRAYVALAAGTGPAERERCAEPMARLAERGLALGVGVCIEHFPGTAFPTVAATLEFIAAVGHPNLYLLFDIGHAQMAGEDPAEVLAAAGGRLGYVHLDDNDGLGDLHLALTDGVQTRNSLAALFAVLRAVGYDGPVSLEMKPDLPDPLDAIRRSVAITRQLLPPGR